MARYKVGLETRDRILDAVRSSLASRGLEGTTINSICQAAGVQAGSFYNLFDSKEQAILAVVREAIEAVDPDPKGVHTDSLADLVGAYVKFITGEPDLARVYIRVGVGEGLGDGATAETFLAHHRRRVERFADALARQVSGIDPEEAQMRAESMLATLNGLAVQWLLDPATDFEAHAERLLV
ncbi:MAG: TetR/AcrR family transcriptional regulator [Acidimicrobiia bacterium]|nr:TetR/AcrR family transcriptional regulator [Acidimicrobiia bacterium]MDH3471567.1 TetR/AcrR family transcriptional regulator [Acidimicrobiia bacterium]